MNLKVENEDISTVHVLGKKDKADKNIIVRFVNRDKKMSILRIKKSLRGKNMFIEEHLTPENSKLLYEARQLKKQNVIDSCWSHNCLLYMKMLDGKIMKFDKMADIDAIKQTKKSTHNLRQRPSRTN